MVLYGIQNCDTVKKAKKWLDARKVEYTFHDLRKDGLTESMVAEWCRTLGWQVLLNRRSTTWRTLDSNVKDHLGLETAIEQMLKHPTLIKRPVLEVSGRLLCGFNADQWENEVV